MAVTTRWILLYPILETILLFFAVNLCYAEDMLVEDPDVRNKIDSQHLKAEGDWRPSLRSAEMYGTVMGTAVYWRNYQCHSLHNPTQIVDVSLCQNAVWHHKPNGHSLQPYTPQIYVPTPVFPNMFPFCDRCLPIPCHSQTLFPCPQSLTPAQTGGGGQGHYMYYDPSQTQRPTFTHFTVDSTQPPTHPLTLPSLPLRPLPQPPPPPSTSVQPLPHPRPTDRPLPAPSTTNKPLPHPRPTARPLPAPATTNKPLPYPCPTVRPLPPPATTNKPPPHPNPTTHPLLLPATHPPTQTPSPTIQPINSLFAFNFTKNQPSSTPPPHPPPPSTPTPTVQQPSSAHTTSPTPLTNPVSIHPCQKTCSPCSRPCSGIRPPGPATPVTPPKTSPKPRSTTTPNNYPDDYDFGDADIHARHFKACNLTVLEQSKIECCNLCVSHRILMNLKDFSDDTTSDLVIDPD